MSRANILVRQIRQLVQKESLEEPADLELLERYRAAGDEGAFTTLVRRHGPLVWNTCRRGLGHQDAEDVFQAVFLVLARKSATVRWRASVAPWLYAVAQRLTCKVRSEAARRPSCGPVDRAIPNPLEDMSAREMLAALDAELAALAEKYRGPLVLCWLEGRTQPEAAQLLGQSLSTVRRRLERGKRLLQLRLARRGLAPALALAVPALASFPERLLAGSINGTAATTRATALAGSMLAAAGKLKTLVALMLAVLVAAVGAGLAAHFPTVPVPPAPKKALQLQKEAGKEPKRVDALGDPLPEGALLRLGSIRLKHRGLITSAVFSPKGTLLASGGWDRVIRLWDPRTGKEVRQWTGPKGGVNCLAFSPDGNLLAGAANDKHVYLWELATGREARRMPHSAEVRTLAVSHGGDLLVAADKAGVRMWEVKSGKELWKVEPQEAKEADFSAVAFSPDGSMVAAADNQKRVSLWQASGGKLLHQLTGHVGPIDSIAFTPGGKNLLVMGNQETRLWDVATGKKLALAAGLNRPGTNGYFSPDGKLQVIVDKKNRIHLNDWATGKEVQAIRRHSDYVRSVGFSPDSKTLVSLADGAAIHLWDVASGKPKLELPGHDERLTSVVYLPDGRTVATASWDGSVRLWDAGTGQLVRRLEVKPDKARDAYLVSETFSQIVVAPDGKQVAALRGHNLLVLWDVATGKEVRWFRGSCVAFSPDGKWMAYGNWGTANDEVGMVHLYDRATDKDVRRMKGHLTSLSGVTFTPDSKTLISRGQVLFGASFRDEKEETKFVRFWDVATGKERPISLGGLKRPTGIFLSPDGRTLASIGRLDNTITLWETATGTKRGTLEGHQETVFGVAFAPDGRTVASASMDGTVRLWDPQAGKEIGRFPGHLGWVLAVAFAPDGKRLISGSLDTMALIWNVSRFTHRPAQVGVPVAELEKAYSELAGETSIGYRAVGRLIAGSGPTVALLRQRLKPAVVVQGQPIAKLIGDLESKQFKVRDLATRELEKLGEQAAPALEKALSGLLPLESKRRLEGLLEKLEGATLSAETRRQVRAVEVLEAIGTPEARAVLETLAGGVPEVRQTREARGALERLKAR